MNKQNSEDRRNYTKMKQMRTLQKYKGDKKKYCL